MLATKQHIPLFMWSLLHTLISLALFSVVYLEIQFGYTGSVWSFQSSLEDYNVRDGVRGYG
jgi:hypothetical protein